MKHKEPSPLLIDMIAQVCHAANKAYCDARGDFSIKPWEEAADNIKESERDGVLFIINNPNAGDDSSHENWIRFKIADGWTYGPIKSENAKTHPCLVPFDDLPPEQKLKDRLFRTIVLAMISE